ncbi:MAG: hypothetical protein GC131_01835 [Alphaproteobacteria bacterium]|nr:hypothetical protein [Alphaproteobacteria bacterium]
MINGTTQGDGKKMLQWVISLAVSIVCCAVLFLVFASFLLDNQRSLMRLQMQQEVIEAKLNTVDANINYMLRHSMKELAQAESKVQSSKITPEEQPVVAPALTPEAPPAVPMAPEEGAAPPAAEPVPEAPALEAPAQ